MNEPLIFDQPISPSRTAKVIGRLNRARAIGHGVGRIGDETVEHARAGLCRPFWWIERELAVRAKVEFALGSDVARGPFIVTLPFIRAGLESDRFCNPDLTFVFQPVSEPGRFDLFAEML